jgi:hypothetical protein
VLIGAAPSAGTPNEVQLDTLRLADILPVALPSELVRLRPDIGAAEALLNEAGATVGVATGQPLSQFHADRPPRRGMPAGRRLRQQAKLGRVRADGRRYVDVVKLLPGRRPHRYRVER